MSVVQATEGSYGIRIGDSPQQDTGQMGAFIAPSGQMQYITHHTDICTNRMQAHWVFFSAVVNERYYLEEICAFPVIMPTKYQTDVYEIIERVRAGGQICNILSSVFRLVGILIEIGTIHDPSNPFVYGARRYIEQHYPEHISDSGLADTLAVSLSTLYRKFQAYFHTTPANYINRFRLNKAALLLENTDWPLHVVSELVGFSDPFYFSKQFKRLFQVSPSQYRKHYTNESTVKSIL